MNLATGEEEYTPPTDLTVYNPIGPSVSLSRLYNSLRPTDSTYESDDFGVGWSHNYNVTVYDPTVNVNSRLLQGQFATARITGTDGPGSGLTWDIVLNGSTVASSSTANGWSVSSTSGSSGPVFNLSLPSAATVATNYEVRYNSTGYPGFGQSARFDVASASSMPQVPQGGSASFSSPGTDAPASGLTWDIVQGATTIATSAVPNGWSVKSPG